MISWFVAMDTEATIYTIQTSMYHFLRFDSSKNQWEISRPMLTLRSRFGVAAVDGLLYTFGGYDGTSRLQTVECFDPKVI